MNISSDKFVRSPGASQVPGSGSRLSRSTAAIVLWLEAAVVPALFGQTLVQLTDLGSNIGPRLTRAVAQARISRSLFGRIGTKVNFINFGTVYQFAGDPDWSRLLVGLKDQWIHEYRNDAGPGGRIQDPGGIDISARKNFYTADQAKARLFAAVFDPNAQNLVSPKSWSGPFPRPVDLAWDGQASPTTLDFLYVLDDSLSSVTYWDVNAGVPGALAWSYGSKGSGVGQLLRPSGICAGKTAASNGGTQFTTYFYVVDRGNRRVVWLNRGSTGPSWLSVVSLSNWDPTDCAVDHFGNLYVVDQSNHHLYKFTYSLQLLATYGTYGKGATNYNTFAWPHAVSVPCGLKTVNSQTVWYCEGRVITAEQWSDSSGAVEHYLGLDVAITQQPSGTSPSFGYLTTDHARHVVKVYDMSSSEVRSLDPGYLTPSGTRTLYWDGYKNDGTPAPSGTYYFASYITSAYGCSGQSWCFKGLGSQTFYYAQTDTAGCNPQGPCSPPVGGASVEAEPTTLFLHQRILTNARPLAKIGGAAPSSVAEAASTPAPTLTELVRRLSLRGLAFSVTRAASTASVTVRVYSLSGRLIRILVNEQLAPGVYEIGWDGADDHGRPAAPGVYVAIMSAGSFRATQRLILRQP